MCVYAILVVSCDVVDVCFQLVRLLFLRAMSLLLLWKDVREVYRLICFHCDFVGDTKVDLNADVV